MVNLKDRYSAVLMSISSLPGEFGIGDFGSGAFEFLNFLKEIGFSAWQVLPFNPPDSGNSPYGSYSAFAGNYLYIDPVYLMNKGWLTGTELEKLKYKGSVYTVDYNYVYKSKKDMLNIAFERAFPEIKSKLDEFLNKNNWANDYAFYMVLKEKNYGKAWQLWPEEERIYSVAIKNKNKYIEKMYFYIFEQYIFSLQYSALKRAAEDLSIAIIGDIPIYVAADSVDVWKNPELFLLDENFNPSQVAGVPPDAFSEEGQLWGNPIYNWPIHEKNNFEWWTLRMSRTFELYDVVRIDHFRGFASYYSVNANEKNAKNGVWHKGPGKRLFNHLLAKFDKNRIIAEDLGAYSEDVYELLSFTKIKGMKVVQFGFDGSESPHLPHKYNKESVAYIGTHDNSTLLGWLWEINENTRKRVLDYCGFKGNDWGKGGYYSESCRTVIETVWKSAAAVAVIPFQDLCGFGNDARMNIPGKPKDNWRFRTDLNTIEQTDKKYFKYINDLFYR